ncbi:MAG: 50S ribosomal protein L10 [Candidatus Berkelbacteria bacterium]|nr:50S ribosomal protein L10 [Candidatus Berkelbacteria bacterium]
MLLTKAKKEQLLADLKGLFSESPASIASDYSGLQANEITELRKKMKEGGIRVIVTKNTLVKKALNDLKIEFDETILDKPVFFAFGEDEVEVAKGLREFSKEHEKLEVLGGIVRGEALDKSKISALALLPGREDLQGKLVGILAAPAYGFVNVLHGNIRGLVNVLGQVKEQKS